MMEITLRPYKPSDLEDFKEWTRDEEVIRFSSVWRYISREDLYLKEVAIPHPWHRAICLRGRPIGYISVEPGPPPLRCRSGLVSYAVGGQYRGKGVMTAVLKMVVRKMFKDRELPDLERLEARVDVHNRASQRVLEKAGFVREGVLRKYVFVRGQSVDSVMYSILSGDPIPN